MWFKAYGLELDYLALACNVVEGLWSRVKGLRFRVALACNVVRGLWSRAERLRFRAWGSNVRVWGLGV